MKKSSEIVKKNKKKYNCKYYNSSFATILRDFLEMKEFNQQKLAEELKVSRQTISLYANGNSLPDIETLKKIIKYFKKNKYDYSSDYWLGLISEPSSDIKIKTINKKYGLSEESLNEIKHSSEYLKDNLNYFLEHIGLLEVTIKSKDYTDISEALNRLSFLLYIEHLSDYIIDKLKLNEKDKLKNFFNYCNQNNEAIFDLLLSYKVDYMPIYQNFKDLYNSIFVEEESFTSQLNNIEKLSKYENNWKNYFEKRDFDGMQKEYDKIQQKLKEIMPLENTIKEARQIENIHNLIKNNGHNFDLTNEQLELSKMLV